SLSSTEFGIVIVDVAFRAAGIAGRPECFGSVVIPLIEQCVESFKYECFVFRCNCLTHHFAPFLSAAKKMRSATSLGCDTMAGWLAGPALTVAPILLAINSAAYGGII